MENTLEELTDSLEGSNVSTLTYYPAKGIWIIKYKNNLTPDEVDTENLLEFINNV